MPLRGFFSKKSKSRTDIADSTPNSPTTAATESPLTSPTADYIKPDSLLPSSPNGRSSLHPDDAFNSPTKSTRSSVYPSVASSPASSSKLRLPFGRKKSPKSSSSTRDQDEHVDVKLLQPRPPFPGRASTGAASESDAVDVRRNLGPPPSRSAIFSAYGDPHSANSTRSLPSEYPASVPTTETLVEPSVVTPKRPLFPWSSKSQPNTTKVKSKAKSTPPKAEDISAALADADPSSFNLKSFRHLRPPSPELTPPPVRNESTLPDSANSSSSSLVPPRPIPGTRSRNASLGSLNDPSASQQRISVAAFREAQARRSLAGSPVPSGRSPSPGPILSAHHRSPEGSEARQRRTSMVALGKDTYSSDSDDYSESEDNTVNAKQLRASPGRKGMSKAKAKSEIGHGSSSTSPYSPSFNGPSAFPRGPGIGLRPDALAKPAVPRSQSDVYGKGVYGSRPDIAASASAGALSSNTNSATKTIPTQPKTNAQSGSSHQVKSTTSPRPQPPSKPTPQSNSDSDSDSDDNAPLATLVPPKRPASAASNPSNNSHSDAVSVRSLGRAGGMRARVISNAKPLIDINELTGPNKRPPEEGVGRKPPKSQEGFTGGATLLSGGATRGPPSISPGPSSVTSTSPPGRRFISPPPSPESGSRPLIRSESTSPQTPSQVPSGLAQRRIPVGKKDTDDLSMTSSRTTGSSNDDSTGPGAKKKDPFSERLSKAVAQTVSSTPTTSPPIPNQLPRALRRESTPAALGMISLDASVEMDMPFTSSPSPTLESPALHHRRRSSDIEVRRDDQPAVRAPSPKPFAIPKRIDYKGKRKSIEPRKSEDSMEDLATLLGAGIKLVTVNGEDQTDFEFPSSTSTERKGLASGMEDKDGAGGEDKDDTSSFAHLAYFDEPPPSPNRIAPIVIKTRTPAPSFSVTSRPKHGRPASVSILTTSSSSETAAILNSAAGNGNVTTATTTTTTTTTTQTHAQTRGPPLAGVTRPRSSTLMSPSSSKPTMPSWSMPTAPNSNIPPPKAKLLLPSNVVPAPASVASSDASSSSNTSASGNASSGYESTPPRQREKTAQPPTTAKPPPRSMSASNMGIAPSPQASAPASRFPAPSKPFANVNESPASSTGGSSSGRGVPVTPRDGSDVGDGRKWSPSKEEQWGSGVSGLSFGGKHGRKRSIAFEDEARAEGKGKESPGNEEARRKERRRSEARAAIELGNDINGPGPILDDDEDEDLPISQSLSAARMGGMNPMMMNGPIPGMPGGFGPQPTGNPMWGWPSIPQMSPGQMLSPAQFMVPPPADPSFFAAHQQAMMFAKQAYQMAVAQQAMAAAAEEWERGSTVGFSSSQSMYGMPPSASPSMSSPYGMGAGGWAGASPVYPSGPRSSMFGGSGAMSEYGGGGGRGGGWSSSRSVYGESFGPSTPHGSGHSPNSATRGRMSSYTRDSGYFPPVPPIPPQANKNSGAPRQSTNPRSRTVSQPAQPVRHHEGGGGSPGPRRAPPSSWKTNGA